MLAAQQAPLDSSRIQPAEPIPLQDTGIPGPITDGTPAVPTPLPEPLQFSVMRTLASRRQVTEAPEISGLPAVKGTINVTVQLVEDPGLPNPPPPLSALRVEEPAATDGPAELSEPGADIQSIWVSATVYDHARTHIRCGLGNGKEIVGWSNIDFNHFCGVGTYQVRGSDGKLSQYSLMMGIGNEETAGSGDALTPAPALPDLATSGPAFVITGGDATDKESMDLFAGLHDLYRVEGARMAAACQARGIAYETQVGDVYRKNPALINTVGGIADAAMHMIPGSGPQGAGAADGSNTTFRLAVDTFRLFGSSLIAMDPGSPRSFRDEVFPVFVKGYNAKYSYGQRTRAEIGTLFAAFVAPEAFAKGRQFLAEAPGWSLKANSAVSPLKIAAQVESMGGKLGARELQFLDKLAARSPSLPGIVNMAGRRALSPGETVIGFMRRDGTLIGAIEHPRIGHDLLASRLGITSAAKNGDVIAFTVGKSSSGSIRGFGSGTFPPPGGIMDDGIRALVEALFE